MRCLLLFFSAASLLSSTLILIVVFVEAERAGVSVGFQALGLTNFMRFVVMTAQTGPASFIPHIQRPRRKPNCKRRSIFGYGCGCKNQVEKGESLATSSSTITIYVLLIYPPSLTPPPPCSQPLHSSRLLGLATTVLIPYIPNTWPAYPGLGLVGL